eukprot:TRINITY_DN2244_c1_g1_i1.p1 TRINITY_DN2244_c1_g1~~TRINITY_DN2244_c1_g1_i1.p1  ORF type:complete len:358 (-),score=80.10 TRINITY_DN2244_c1_g1_i1:19-1092(-)
MFGYSGGMSYSNLVEMQPSMVRQMPFRVGGEGGVGGIKLFRLCIVTNLGTFYVVIDPNNNFEGLKMAVKEKVWEMYRISVTITRVQDDKRVDLCPSYKIGSLVDDHSTILIQHTLNNMNNVNNIHNNNYHLGEEECGGSSTPSWSQIASPANPVDSPLSPMDGTTSFNNHSTNLHQPTPIHHQIIENNTKNQNSSSLIQWVDIPPQKIVQNKRFSFSFSLSAMVTGFNLNPSPLHQTLSLDKIPFEVCVEEENKCMVESDKFSFAVQKQEQVSSEIYKVFMKIGLNSNYGRTRFIIKVSLLNSLLQSRGLLDSQNKTSWLISEPVVVISKIRNKRKRTHEEEEEKEKESTSNSKKLK